jgi:NAD-dependent deacetylase
MNNSKLKGKLIVFSGAGLSAESGISTFRDANGLWENHRIEHVCHYPTWRANKKLVFDFYNQRRMQLNSVEPNAAHHAIAAIEKELGEDKFIHITQNIDDLIERAGGSAIHVHGNLRELKCEHCNALWDIGYTEAPHDLTCPNCNRVGDVKPYVVFFGERAPYYPKMWEIFSNVTDDDVVLVIGTSGNVIAFDQMIPTNSKAKKLLLTMDKGRNNIAFFDHWYRGKAGEMINAVLDDINK